MDCLGNSEKMRFDSSNKVYIIAEAGVNHNGKLSEAIKLVDAAKYAGANAVKFQTFDLNSNYSLENTSNKKKKWVKDLSLSKNEFEQLFEYCKSLDIEFMSTPFDIKSASFINELGVKIFKISSSELCNIKLLKYLSNIGKPIFLSTGLSQPEEIELAFKILKENWNNNYLQFNKALVFLYCVSIYPAPFDCFDMMVIPELKKKFNIEIGFSDHSLGIELPIASVALGAKVLEKHIKISDEDYCPDSNVSLNPNQFKLMVESIRNVEMSLLKKKNSISELEKKNRNILRKGMYWSKDLKKGKEVMEQDIEFKKPCLSLGIEYFPAITGKILQKNVFAGDPVFIEEINS